MQISPLKFWILSGALFLDFIVAKPLEAQIVTDQTLPNNSVVTSNCTVCEITGGTRVGNNLFHSFGQFSVPRNGSAYFNNDATVSNIISRVTGQSISNIDGLIHANGTANLFLLNPNGIIFGSHASLDIGGSFLASTANRLLFEDGAEFRVADNQTNSLLTISTPIGLGFGSNAGSIINQSQASLDGAINALEQPVGLQVQPGRSLVLVGNGLTLSHGNLSAFGGRVELGSVADSSVVRLTSLNPSFQGWALDYQGVRDFQDIHLSNSSQVDASGTDTIPGGIIRLHGQRIVFTGASQAFAFNSVIEPGNDLSINATDAVIFRGIDSSFFTQTSGDGAAGNFTITARNLILRDGAAIGSFSVGGRAGTVILRASDSIEVTGTGLVADDERNPSIIFNFNNEGTLDLETSRLVVQDGGQISSSTFGSNDAGHLRIRADSILARGSSPNGEKASGLFAQAEEGATGNAGTLRVDTRQLTVLDGAQISTSARGEGQAGRLTINASEFILLSGFSPLDLSEFGRSGIFVSAESGAVQSAGNLVLNTGHLTIENGARISADNFSAGNRAGNITISAERLILNRGEINATTNANNGANIRLRNLNLLLMSNNSRIFAQASNAGNGGNIRINTANGFVVTAPDQNNDIRADAFEGQGGNIQIRAQGIVGIEERPSVPENITNDIDASSQFGQAGTVTITRTDVDPSRGLTELSAAPAAPEPTQGCQVAGGQAAVEFYNTGRGGVAPTPYEPFSSSDILDDVRLPERNLATARATTNSLATSEELPNSIVEAQGWKVDETGRVVLLAALPEERSHVFCHLR